MGMILVLRLRIFGGQGGDFGCVEYLYLALCANYSRSVSYRAKRQSGAQIKLP